MTENLTTSVRTYVNDTSIGKRYIRPKEAAEQLGKTEEEVLELASMAEAICQLPVITLISCKKLEDYMKHLYKIAGTNKYVQKKYVNATEGAIIYSLGKTRFMALAKEAGAVYKVGNSALVNTEIFEDYLEQFHEPAQMLLKHSWRNKAEANVDEQIEKEEDDNE